MRCAWAADRKGNHTTMDCYRQIRTKTGTANFPKAKDYQKLRVGAYELEEDQKDLCTEGSDSDELRYTASGSGGTKESIKESTGESNEELSEESTERSEGMATWWSD
jgi:hypothetical protein